MTKTYYDIDAVNKLLEEVSQCYHFIPFSISFFKISIKKKQKEKDLELAATIGKHLLDKGQDLETRIEILEEQLEKATDMVINLKLLNCLKINHFLKQVNQLRHEITLKDDLLTNFIELDNGSDDLK